LGRGQAGLDRAGCDEERGPSGRGAGGGWPGEVAGGEEFGDTRSLGSGGGASLRLGRGQSPDRAALQRLSSGTTQVLSRNREDQGAWRLGRCRGPQPGTPGARALLLGRGPGHVSRGASEQRVRGRAPGIVGARARGGGREV
jgi:hypothetical protein